MAIKLVTEIAGEVIIVAGELSLTRKGPMWVKIRARSLTKSEVMWKF